MVEHTSRVRGGWVAAGAVAVAAVAWTTAGVHVALGIGEPPPVTRTVVGPRRPTFDFVVPAGTADRLAAGDAVSIMPSPLVVSVGDTIRIRNRDRETIVLGPFVVGAHARLTERFVRVGRLVGDCVAHPSGRLVVEVRP